MGYRRWCIFLQDNTLPSLPHFNYIHHKTKSNKNHGWSFALVSKITFTTSMSCCHFHIPNPVTKLCMIPFRPPGDQKFPLSRNTTTEPGMSSFADEKIQNGQRHGAKPMRWQSIWYPGGRTWIVGSCGMMWEYLSWNDCFFQDFSRGIHATKYSWVNCCAESGAWIQYGRLWSGGLPLPCWDPQAHELQQQFCRRLFKHRI